MTMNDPTDPRTIVSKFLDSLTSGQVAVYIRIALYSISGFFASKGYYASDDPLVNYFVSSGVFAGTLAWTIWGQSLVNRVKNLMATGHISVIVTNDRSLSNAVPNTNVVAAEDTTVVSSGLVKP